MASPLQYWKSPLLAARANNFTAFASKVADLGLASTLGADNLTATIFAPSEHSSLLWGPSMGAASLAQVPAPPTHGVRCD